MKSLRHIWPFALALLLAVPASSPAAPAEALPAALAARPGVIHESRALRPGVTYHSAYFPDLFGDGPVATYWLVIDWDETDGKVSLNIARRPERRTRPTELMKDTGAFATVNGTYHSTTDPSTPYYQLKVNGALIPSLHAGGDGTLAFNRGEMPYIGRFSTNLLVQYENVISGDGVPGLGKPLPDYGDKTPAAVKRRAASRSPRTFAGNDLEHRCTILGIADGRTSRSMGLNYVETRYLLETWGCDPGALVSLDGGGSTVMALLEEGRAVIKNIPSDGNPLASIERRVAEAIQLIPIGDPPQPGDPSCGRSPSDPPQPGDPSCGRSPSDPPQPGDPSCGRSPSDPPQPGDPSCGRSPSDCASPRKEN